MNKRKQIFNKLNSIRFISMLMLVCICVIVISLIAGGSYLAYRTSLLDVIGTNRSDVLSQIGSRVHDFKSNAYTISNLYYNDARFIQYTKNLTPENEGEFAAYMDSLTAQYKISFNQVNLDYYVVYLSSEGIGYCSDEVPDDYDYINPTIRIWYQDIYKANGGIVDVASYKDKALGVNSFVAARAVLGTDGKIIGYLMINVNEQQIYHTYSDVIATNSNIYITDSDGYIISSNVTKIVGFQYFNMKNLDTLFGNNVYAIVQMPYAEALFSKYNDAAYGFTVFEETPLDYLLQPIKTTRNVVVIITLCVTLLGVLLAWFFSGKITQPIMKLRDYVLRVEEGELNATLTLNSYSEINTLSFGIQQMLARIRSLIESEKKKEEQKRKMQYHLLQAQINPHFMYNTLFSIKCVVDMNENQKASSMLAAFIHLLRSTLSNPDALSTVRQQMDALQQYADLQRFRYGEKFDVVIEYDDAIAECLLPSLIIQPLVENSIIHGMEHFESYGVIAVSGRIKHEKIVIEVEDNGVGMTDEQITAIFEGENDTEKPHIGIKNINERIKLSFGDAYGLRIESQWGEGTKILMSLPIIRKEVK